MSHNREKSRHTFEDLQVGDTVVVGTPGGAKAYRVIRTATPSSPAVLVEPVDKRGTGPNRPGILRRLDDAVEAEFPGGLGSKKMYAHLGGHRKSRKRANGKGAAAKGARKPSPTPKGKSAQRILTAGVRKDK